METEKIDEESRIKKTRRKNKAKRRKSEKSGCYLAKRLNIYE